MKNKIWLMLLTFCLMVTAACSQVDKPAAGATDDATMGRLRVAYIVYGGPNVDVLIDGEIAMFGAWEQTDLSPGYVGGYLYLEPGTHSVAVVPTGQGVADALLSEEVTLEAGHRYTVATMGQVEDESLTPLVIDETTAVQEVRTDPSQSIMILVNNLAGAETLSITFNGEGPKDAPYGGFAVAPVPLGPERYIEVSANGGEDIIETEQWDENSNTEIPGENFMHLRFGHFPGTWGEDHSDTQGIGATDLNTLEFLRGFSGRGVQQDGQILSFDTFLEAVERTGLTDVLETGNPYWLLAPTDEAFAALPQDRLDALMADPEALADLLRNHIIEGYLPDLPDMPTSMSGVELDRNSIPFLGLFLLSDDGSHLSAVSSVLFPPDEACKAEQAAPPNIAPRPLAEHTMGLWLFDESEGNTAGDASGHDHHGAFVNAAWAEGKFGSVAQIVPGENYVEVEATDETLSPDEEMTVTAWVYLEALPDPEEEFPNRRILEAATYDPEAFEFGGGDNHYGLHFQWGRFIFRPGPNAQPGSVGVDQGESIEPGGWQHVAGVYSGAFVRLYVGGELRSEVKSNCEALVQPENNRLFIGTKAPEAPDGDWWDGLIDEVAISDVALTEEEIGSVMQGLGAIPAD